MADKDMADKGMKSRINWARLLRLSIARMKADDQIPRGFNAAAGLAREDWIALDGGRPIPALKFLRLCHHLGLDPTTLRPAAETMPPFRGAVLWPFLAAGVTGWLDLNGHTVRDAARATGLSTATISKAANGKVLSADSLLRLAAYTHQHPHEVTGHGVTGHGVTGHGVTGHGATGRGATGREVTSQSNRNPNENKPLTRSSPVKHARVKHPGDAS